MDKVLQWIKKNGGVKEMSNQSDKKSKLLYETIEQSNGYYSSIVHKDARSRINITFRVGGENGNEELENKFIVEAEKNYMMQLKGHRLLGGIRASLYNAVSYDDVKSLVTFMKQFQKDNPIN